ncbi:MAG: hypothetical protein JO149_03355 [Gammaproteobacteria bacterium]|nr:hypothetical protein [Gammaproteobacteria bacterium]
MLGRIFNYVVNLSNYFYSIPPKTDEKKEAAVVVNISSSHAAIQLTLPQQVEETVQPDALSRYQHELSKKAAELQKTLEKLQEFKIKILEKNVVLEAYADDLSEEREKIKSNALNSMQAFLDYLMQNVKAGLWPADNVLNNLLESSDKEMAFLFRQLNADNNALDDKDKSEEEKQRICLEMFNLNILIVEDLLKLIANIQAELKYCVEIEKISAKAIEYLAEITIRMVLNVALPNLNLDFSEFYHHFLSNEISNEKKSITTSITFATEEIAATIQKVEKHFSDNDKLANTKLEVNKEEKPQNYAAAGPILFSKSASVPQVSEKDFTPEIRRSSSFSHN